MKVSVTIRILKALNIVLDLCSLNLALAISFYIGANKYHTYLGQHNVLLFVLVINLVWLFMAKYFNIYEQYNEKNAVTVYQQMINAFFSFAVWVAVIAFFLVLRDKTFERLSLGPSFYLFLFIFYFFSLTMIRLLLLGVRKKYAHKDHTQRKRVLVVGGDCFSEEMGKRLFQEDPLPFDIVGVFYNRQYEIDDGLNGMYKGRFEEAFEYMNTEKVDEVLCIGKGLHQPEVLRLMEATEDKVARFRMLIDVYDYLPSQGHFEMVNKIPVFRARTEPLQVPENALIKRAFDLLFSGIVIIFILSWLLPILAVLIKLESRGSVFFRQKRVGMNNKPFTCLKLRSMYENKDADHLMASKNDPRVTKTGAFLRKTSLDELPQFFNVFIGNMSVVGPRPHMLSDIALYSKMAKQYMIRHYVKPGISGWAQIAANRGETKTSDAVEGRVRADIWYMENWSTMLDLKIIFLTLWKVIKGDESAY